ncbi:MAG: AAA family ATPase [Halanaerobiaceae bacterium]
MIIKKMFLRDFGIFDNEHIEDIAPGLVVIGGLNRAGKTTFLKALRHLGFGFPRNGLLPQARDRHHIEGLIEANNNQQVKVILRGFAEPQFNYINNTNEDNHVELFKNIDFLTYQQLFTITLDELKKIPKGVSANDFERLQSILLGAGLGEINKFPILEEKFTNLAEKIGGKKGNPEVWAFKPYADKISSGLKMKKTAYKQLEEYYTKKNRLKKINEELNTDKKELNKLSKKITRLDILKNNYDIYHELIQIETKFKDTDILEDKSDNYKQSNIDKAEELKEEYQKINYELQEKNTEFKQEINCSNTGEIKEKLTKLNDKIIYNRRQIAGLKVKVENYQEKLSEHQSEMEEIQKNLNEISEDFNGDIEKAVNISTDNINKDNLFELIDEYNQEKNKIKQEQEKYENLKHEKNEYKNMLESLTARDLPIILRIYFIGAAIFTIMGFGLSYINFWFGLIGLTGLVGLSFYMIYKYTTRSNIRNKKENIELELDVIEKKIYYQEEEIEKSKISFKDIKGKLKNYKNKLNITQNINNEQLKEYFKDIKIIKRDIIDWKKKEEKLENLKKELLEELEKVYNILKQFEEISLFSNNKIEKDKLIEEREKLFIQFVQLNQYLDTVNEIKKTEAIKTGIKNKILALPGFNEKKDNEIIKYLNKYITVGKKYIDLKTEKDRYNNMKEQLLQVLKTERINEALQEIYDKINNKDKLAAFDYIYKQYTSTDEVNRVFQEKQQKLNSLKNKMEDNKELSLRLEERLKELSTSEKIEKSQELIDEGRKVLEGLAEKYAVYKTAGFILEKVRHKFMEKTMDKLLEKASYYFSNITGDEYKKIEPDDKLSSSDFKAILKNGTIQTSTDMLSRATAEQLFLSVRISRIREINPSLPVIIDDGLVNFDNYHLDNTLDILLDLAKTNQVFLLTCHSHLINVFSKTNKNIQYWKLEKGKFSRSNDEELKRYLSN